MKNTRSERINLIKQRLASITPRLKKLKNRAVTVIDNRPLASFFGLLAVIVILIVVGNTLRKPSVKPEEKIKTPKAVEVFSIGKAPRMNFSGTVEKTGVVKLVAQTAGVVQQVNKFEGAAVGKGETLFWLSSNYQGGTIPTINRQIAEKSYQSTEANYPTQKQMIAKRREIAHNTDGTQDELRAITAASIEDTKNLVALNEHIVANLQALVESNGGNDTASLQMLAGAMGGLQALQMQLATNEFQTGGDQEPQALSDLGKDVTLTQLDLEERGLELSREISKLNLNISQIMESMSYPAAVCNGTIERVHVSYGEAVNPGQTLASLVCNKTVTNVVVLVSSDIAKQLSQLEKSNLLVGGKTVELTPRYISKQPTEGNLHSVIFTLSAEEGEALSNGSAVTVEMPIGNAKATASVPYVPIDAVFQTQTSSIIYLATQSAEGKFTADDREIILGPVFGSYVEVQKGLSAADHVILNRDIIAGDEVTIQ